MNAIFTQKAVLQHICQFQLTAHIVPSSGPGQDEQVLQSFTMYLEITPVKLSESYESSGPLIPALLGVVS